MDRLIFLRGLLVGFSIAAPVGPIGVLCIRRTLSDGRLAGLLSGLGAATADSLYGAAGAFGLTAVSVLLVGQQWLRLLVQPAHLQPLCPCLADENWQQRPQRVVAAQLVAGAGGQQEETVPGGIPRARRRSRSRRAGSAQSARRCLRYTLSPEEWSRVWREVTRTV